MSTSPSAPAPESRPPWWLPVAISLALTLAGFAAQWGTLGSDVRHLDRRTTATEAEVARLAAAQSKTDTQLARIETRLDGVERQLERLALAVERLTTSRTARDLP